MTGRSTRGGHPKRHKGLPKGVQIIFEDEDVLVVEKPSGLVTADPRPAAGPRVPGRDLTLFDALKTYIRSTSARLPRRNRDSEEPRRAAPALWVLHRLDKEASGLVVFAKTERAFAWLKDDFKAKRVQRHYIAVTEGVLGEVGSTGTRQSFIREDRGGMNGPRRRPADDEGQLAVTHYTILAVGNDRTLIQARLETGRKNQIRIHMQELKHPLIGDRRFGAISDPIGRLALHAAELGFSHPADGRSLLFKSPAPPAFYKAAGAELTETHESTPQVATASTSTPASPPKGNRPASERETSWQAVAGWYDELLSDRGNDHYEQVIGPGTMRLLAPTRGMRVLDVACGQGMLARRLSTVGCSTTGIDAAPGLIEAARKRAEGDPSQTFVVGDARAIWNSLPEDAAGSFDAAACIMALSNIDSLEPVLDGVARALRPGGVFVFVITHPAFRAIGQTSWGWDDKAVKQYRRVEGYLSPASREVDMQPGRAAHGKKSSRTITFHRPLQTYIAGLSKAGLLVERLEEWPSLRASTSGPRAAEENRIRREIPLFLGVRAIKR